jgi:hypothetical protein
MFADSSEIWQQTLAGWGAMGDGWMDLLDLRGNLGPKRIKIGLSTAIRGKYRDFWGVSKIPKMINCWQIFSCRKKNRRNTARTQKATMNFWLLYLKRLKGCQRERGD